MLWLFRSFVLNCPVNEVSARAMSFDDLGWKGCGFQTLKAQMKKTSGLTDKTWQSKKDDNNEFLIALHEEGVEDFYSLEHEFAIYAQGSKRKIEGLFYLIRNSLAHGSFRFHSTKNGMFLAMETVNHGKLRGRALIKLDSLKSWRTLLDHSENYLK